MVTLCAINPQERKFIIKFEWNAYTVYKFDFKQEDVSDFFHSYFENIDEEEYDALVIVSNGWDEVDLDYNSVLEATQVLKYSIRDYINLEDFDEAR